MSVSANGRPLRVVVVGAGVSGLACARKLVRDAARKNKLPVEVLVLEGRNRLGGRAWTYQLDDGIVVDLGGSWIHGWRGNPLTDLAEAAGMDLSPPGFDSKGDELVYDGQDGWTFPESVVESAWKVNRTVFGCAEVASKGLPAHIKQDRTKDVPVGDVVEPDLQKSIAELRARLAKQPEQRTKAAKHGGDAAKDAEKKNAAIEGQRLERLVDMFVAGREGYFNATMRQLSFNWMYDDEEDDELGGDRLVRNGYGRLVAYLAKGLDIRLEHVVTQVRDRGASSSGSEYRYSVHTQSGSVFEADCVVITVPLGVLKAGSIEFSPQLPLWKTEAIQRMGFGLLDKVVLQFTQPFWGENMCWVAHASPRHGEFPYFLSMFPEIGKPVLVAFVNNDFARQLEALPDDEVIQRALNVLSVCSQWPSDAPSRHFVRGVVTRWSSDAFARGSYSFIAVGGSGEDYDALAKPLGEDASLRFAGEGTNRHRPGTVTGAYLSGVREARHLLRDWSSNQAVSRCSSS